MKGFFSKIFKKFHFKKNIEDEIARNHGERQASKKLSGIRPDHRARYYYASSVISNSRLGLRVLDAASGVGYGAYILATQTEAEITALDIDEKAIQYGETHYNHRSITRKQMDISRLESLGKEFDVIVSFETIEHVPFYKELLKSFYNTLAKEGTLFISTPNESKLQYSLEKFPHHVRHFTDSEFKSLLQETGFTVTDTLTQHNKYDGVVCDGSDGLYNLYRCEK